MRDQRGTLRGAGSDGERGRGPAPGGFARDAGAGEVAPGERYGSGHTAYATGTPSLSLFWRSFPFLSGPLTDQDVHKVLYKGELCQACEGGRRVYPACASAITMDEVLAMARAGLEGVTATREER